MKNAPLPTAAVPAAPRDTVAAGEVHALRQACGWTHGQLADALGVLPAEVAAWEAGTLPLSGGHARWLRWHARSAAADDALRAAGAEPCPWIVFHRERLVRTADEGDAWLARRELRAHREACAACWRAEVLAGHPPQVPDLPPNPGLAGLRDRMSRAISPPPLWQRLIFRSVRLAAVIVLCLVGAGIAAWIEEPSAGFHVPFQAFVPLFGVLAVAGLVHGWMRAWDDEHPVLASQARVAAFLVPAVLAMDLYSGDGEVSGMWWVALVGAVFLGSVLGLRELIERDRDEDQGAQHSSPSTETNEWPSRR